MAEETQISFTADVAAVEVVAGSVAVFNATITPADTACTWFIGEEAISGPNFQANVNNETGLRSLVLIQVSVDLNGKDIICQAGRTLNAAGITSSAKLTVKPKSDAKYPPEGLAESIHKLPQWIQDGCGDEEYFNLEKNATFLGSHMPDNLPDLSNHNSYFSEAMKANPDLYHQLKDKKTSLGVTLGHCIKTGIDNPGHPHIKTVGMVAGDEESYELFAPLFDPVISARHNGYAPDAVHPTNLNVEELSQTKIDPDGKYVLTTRCRTGRSVKGFRLPPCVSFEERRKLEGVIVKSLLTLKDDLAGDYFPLHGSTSYEAKPTGMTLEKEEELRTNGNLFQEPDSTLLLSSGCGRHWPDARGIYHNNDANLFVWVNEEDQMRIVSMEKGDNVRGIIERFAKATQQIQLCLQEQGFDFMRNDHLGWVLTCPSNLGTGLRAGAMVKVPLFSAREDFKKIMAAMGLQARGCGGVDSDSVGGTWDISNADRLGKSEVELVNIFIEGVAQIIQWEKKLEAGEDISSELPALPAEAESYPPTGLSASVKKLPAWIQAGCGNDEYYCEEKGATFLGGKMPETCPDLTNHSSFFAEAMKNDPTLYDKLKDRKTSLGVTLGHCIKTGVDNPGHPHIKTVGLVAGDEESYTVFKELFDPVVSARHNGYAADAHHPTDLDVSKLSKTKIDPSGKYVLTTRCRTGRSVRGFRLPPCCDFEERRKLEDIIVKSLLSLQGDLQGDYFPLHGSKSYAPKPNGMSLEKEDELRTNGNLFQEPDSTLLLSSGCGRHWPDARGIYHNNDANLFVWVNEEDQMRIVSMEKGDNVQRIIERFAKGTEQIQKCLQEHGFDFMHNDHLGWVLTCPSNLGTGLRAGAMVKVPLFSSRADFKAVLGKMGLQARGCGGVDSDSVGGTWDISNADRLGKSEVELVNIFIEGVAQIIQWEQLLEKGKSIEHLVYPPEIVYGMVPAHEPFRFTQPLKPAKVNEGDKIILECELSHNKDVTWLRGRGRCQVGSHYEVISVGMRRTLIIMDAQYSDDAVFTCVTEDDEKCSAKLDVIMQEKKVKKVEKPKEVVKKVEFDDKKSYELVESLFELKTTPAELEAAEAEANTAAFYTKQSEVEGMYTPEPLSSERQMALPYLQMADPVREAIPKVPCWRKWTSVKKQHLMHDWSKEIAQMESQWEKRRNAQADKRFMEAEEARAKLESESNTIPDRLATKLNVEHDLIGPIEADRGDPYALQRTQEHRQRVENFVKRVNKQYRLMDEVEQVNVFQKTFLETYLEKEARKDKYSYVESDYIDNSKNISRRLTRMRNRHEDMLKEMKTTTHSVNKALGFSIDV